MWFSQPYIAKSLADGMVVKVTGRVAGEGAKIYLANPEIDRSPIPPEEVHDTLFMDGAASVEGNDLHAIYPESKGVSSLWFYHAVRRLFELKAHEAVEDPIPAGILKQYNLPTLATALIWMHAPQKVPDATAAKKRFAFEEVFAIQLATQTV